MEIAALLLALGVLILVGIYLYAPFLDRRAHHVTEEEHELSMLMAERDRALNSLQELDFDFTLGKIPEEDYPVQRANLLQRGAEVLRKLDEFNPTPNPPLASLRDASRSPKRREASHEDSIEKAIAKRRNKTAEPIDDDIESMIAARRKGSKNKPVGFCPKCGKPVTASDRFCPSCGKALN